MGMCDNKFGTSKYAQSSKTKVNRFTFEKLDIRIYLFTPRVSVTGHSCTVFFFFFFFFTILSLHVDKPSKQE